MELKRRYIDDIDSTCKRFKTHDIERILNYTTVPSLESIAIVNITTILFKQSDIIDALQNHSKEYDPVGCEHGIRGDFHKRSVYAIEKKVFEKLVFLSLPNLLRTKISNIVKPILLQILKWIRYDRKDIEYINSICWSPEGIIDKTSTLKYLLGKEEDIGQYLEGYYKLACTYCCEESILHLWDKLSDETKREYLCSKNYKFYKNYQNHLLIYWTHKMNSDLSVFLGKMIDFDENEVYQYHDSLNKNMFQLAIYTSNIIAVKYFWNKLTYVEISSNIASWVKLTAKGIKISGGFYQKVCGKTDILYFLLSKMSNRIEQEEFLKENYVVILNSLFLHWPWQKLLLPTIRVLWNHLHEEFYPLFIYKIACRITKNKTTEYLLSELWSDSPTNIKRHFIQTVLKIHGYIAVFCFLLMVEKVVTIRAILEYANIEEQKQLMFLMVKNKEFFFVIYSDNIQLFDNLCADILSQSEIKCIKENIVSKHGNDSCKKWIENGDWKKVKKFLNWVFDTPDKIEHFKKKTLDKVEITYSLLYDSCNYELVNEFMSWCFRSEDEVHKFKIQFSKIKPERILKLGYDWEAFEKFVDWCFDSVKEVREYKLFILQSQFWNSISSCIIFDNRFDFAENLMEWCCDSIEEMKQLKKDLVLSHTWLELLQRFVMNCWFFKSVLRKYELIEKLIDLVSPLEEEVITKLKENIESEIYFLHHGRKTFLYPLGEKEHLFRLLDSKINNNVNSDCDCSSHNSKGTDGAEIVDDHNVSSCST